jgi:hypothetical protein
MNESVAVGGTSIIIALIASVAVCIILEQKGHSVLTVIGNGLFSLFCCWPLALVSALSAKDLNRERERENIESEMHNMRVVLHRLSRDSSVDQPQLPYQPETKQISVEVKKPIVKPTKSITVKRIKAIKTTLDHQEIKVRCTSCKAKFLGTVNQLVSMKSCQACGSNPFRYKQVKE